MWHADTHLWFPEKTHGRHPSPAQNAQRKERQNDTAHLFIVIRRGGGRIVKEVKPLGWENDAFGKGGQLYDRLVPIGVGVLPSICELGASPPRIDLDLWLVEALAWRFGGGSDKAIVKPYRAPVVPPQKERLHPANWSHPTSEATSSSPGGRWHRSTI